LDAHVSHQETLDQVMSELKPELAQRRDSLNLKKVTGQFRTRGLQNFAWPRFEVVGENFELISSGGWDEKDDLYGAISITEKGKAEKWQLKGSRSKPLFIKD
jgi:hypothetical protein